MATALDHLVEAQQIIETQVCMDGRNTDNAWLLKAHVHATIALAMLTTRELPPDYDL